MRSNFPSNTGPQLDSHDDSTRLIFPVAGYSKLALTVTADRYNLVLSVKESHHVLLEGPGIVMRAVARRLIEVVHVRVREVDDPRYRVADIRHDGSVPGR